MATATEYKDYSKGFGRPPSRVSGGYEGKRTFLVNSDVPADIYAATGMPAFGDEFPGFPISSVSCKAWKIEPAVPKGGPGPGGSGSNPGWTWVDVYYRTPSLGYGGGPNPEPIDPVAGDRYTLINFNAGGVEINTDTSGTAIKPTTRDVSTGVAIVRVYKSGISHRAEYTRIKDSVNSASVTLHNRLGVGSGVNETFAARTLRMQGMREEVVRPGLILVEYEIAIAEARTGGTPAPGEEHVYYYQEEDDDGTPISSVGPAEIYAVLTWDQTKLFGSS